MCPRAEDTTAVLDGRRGGKGDDEDVRDWFKYYTVGFANYPVPDKYLKNPVPIPVNVPMEAVAKEAGRWQR